MNLKKIVLYLFGFILIIGLFISVQGLIDTEKQSRKPRFSSITTTSSYFSSRRQEANEKLMIGMGMSLVSGTIVYLTYTNEFEIIMKKSKKKVAKELKKILEEESD